MNPTIRHTLRTVDDGIRYIDALHAAGLLYHFDDDPADCLAAYDLSTEQYDAIEHNSAQLADLDWRSAGWDCPFEYALSLPH